MKADNKDGKVCGGWAKCRLETAITRGARCRVLGGGGGGRPPVQHPRERVHLAEPWIPPLCTSSLLHSENPSSPTGNHEWGDRRTEGRREVQKAHLLQTQPACNLFDIIN